MLSIISSPSAVNLFFLCFLMTASAATAEDESDSKENVRLVSPPSLTMFKARHESETVASLEELREHEYERMAVIQNLNYLDNVLANLDEERSKLEAMWTAPEAAGVDVRLQRTSKALWRKTKEQIDLLKEKKVGLLDVLKKLAFEDAFDPDNENLTETTSTTAKSEPSTFARAISQFFIFGTLFGVVVTITVCSCFLQPKNRRSRGSRVSSLSNLNPGRIPEPFDMSKPCFLKADSNGRFYASPIDGEIPHLPSYEAALNLPKNLVITSAIATQTSQSRLSSSSDDSPPPPRFEVATANKDPDIEQQANLQIQRY